MEIEVKIGHLKTNSRGNIEMTRREFREYLKSFCEDNIMVTLLSCISWLMEEPEFVGSDERYQDIFENVQRIIQTVYDPNQAFDKRDLARVVANGTGIKVRWKQ